MFNVIRLPTKFSRTIKRFSQKEKAELLDTLIKIGDGESVIIEDNLLGDQVRLIYGEWMNMESKNGNKPETSLIKYTSESLAKVTPSKPTPRVEESRVEYNKIEESNIVVSSEIIETKVSTLQGIIKNTFSLGFITEVYNKYSMSKEEFKEECELFDGYWNAPLLKGRDKGKPRWEGEKTFDAKLRFRTWIKNNDKWSNRVIINSEDEERTIKLKELEEKKKLLFNKL